MSGACTKKTFQDLIGTHETVFEWLNETPYHGPYFCSVDRPSEFYISKSLFITLKYDDLSEEDQEKAWEAILGVPGRYTISGIVNAVRKGETLEKKYLFSFLGADGRPLVVKAMALVVEGEDKCRYLILKFTRKFSKNAQIDLYESKIKRLRSFSEIYEESNELAKVGGWDVDLVKGKITWTPYINKIHEVPVDYTPQLEGAINFFKEGWSRDKITQCFQNAVEKGEPYDEEFILVAANGAEKWVRSVAKSEFKDGKCLRVYGAFQDITEAKEQELARQEAETRFREIFNNSAVGIILVKNVSEVFMVNKAALNIFGLQSLSEEAILKYTFSDIIKPEYLEEAREKRRALLGGEIANYKLEVECYHSSGRVIWCSMSSSVFKDGITDKDLVITQVEDITQQKKLEILAQKSAARFKRVFENSPNGMAVVDLHGDWVMINKNLAQMVGYTNDELLELSLEEITHPEDRANDVALFKEILNKKIDSYSIEKRYVHKNGSLVHCFLTVSALYDETGHISSLIGQVVDMTENIKAKKELQRSLNDLQVVLDATSEVIIIETGANHLIKKFNRGAENLLGYTAAEVVGKHTPGIFHLPREIAEQKKHLEFKYGTQIDTTEVFTYAYTQGDRSSNEWTYVRKDGKTFIGQLLTSAILDEQGRTKGYLGIATDITSLKEMELSLRNAKLKAEAASKSKSEFLANMSHEIRTPLNGVIGFTDLLLKTPLNENQAQYAETAYSSAVSLLDLINDILDFSKIEAGKLNLSLERVDIVEVCGRTVEMVKQAAHKKGLEILLNLPNEFDNFVMADGLRLRQILINLISNAIKFTHKGEIELKVRQLGKVDKSGKMRYCFSLRDTGIGIAPQNLKKIFRAFDQEDSSTTRKYGGTGLGLTISNKLLGLMKSNLKVESELGEGTTFSFEVDFNSLESGEIKPAIKRSLKRVLVVDDNKNNRTIMQEMLKDRDIETTLVSNGIDAIEILERDANFDLAIVDYHMPYLNGLDLIGHLRQELKISRKQLGIVMMHSSGHDQEIADKSKDLDIDIRLVKPVLREQLIEYLESLEQPGEIQVSLPEPVEQEIDLSNLKISILFAEDNPVNKFLTRTILGKVVPLATISEASHGGEAVEVFKNQHVDLILMDIQMPVMSGFEATAAIRKLEKQGKRIPIVALTARAIKGERERCLDQDMDDYLAKPVVLEDLKKCIARVITNKTFDFKNLTESKQN
ncbi:PAS domain-containing hybrid sensor histidine kinase/response regulator [Leeuwenhoekiella parthenopeia]|uniref:histidine kinase n=1 Tax=Leeuwenhoekiella parthenopeia TaxID=2890320 RepID=A0ABS8GTJ7_9FLAO|nr:PAS domain S-box protein [Leeuwenhoekiella parthenopeia]MCC4213282.1 PAS domain S-box protein [Leeuwenhoekiella parthenopeia]